MGELKDKLLTNACHFAYFHEVIFFDELRDHLRKLDGVKITEFEFDGVIKIWIEFDFLGCKFFINNRAGDYWFWVENPGCSEDVLLKITKHFRNVLKPWRRKIPKLDFVHKT